jgi:hypothetical protein
MRSKDRERSNPLRGEPFGRMSLPGPIRCTARSAGFLPGQRTWRRAIRIATAGSVAHETAGRGELASIVNLRSPVAGRKRDE